MGFNHLNVPDSWNQYYTKYPEGYTILESLLNWVQSVNDLTDNVNTWDTYLDNFVLTFDKNLQDKVTTVLQDWRDSGFLDQAILSALDKLGKTYVNIEDYPRLEGEVDDTLRLRRAVTKAIEIKGKVILSQGTYIVSDTLELLNGQMYGASIEGADEIGVTIETHLLGTTPLFSLKGWSGEFTNAGVRNVNIKAGTEFWHNGTAIQLDGVCFARFENIHIHGMKYGLWLYNNRVGTYTEVNEFHNIEIHETMEQIRFEKNQGDDSFHGNRFDNVFLNIFANQIGINHVSGYLYHARFDVLMWNHDVTGVYIKADGNAELLQGAITYESFQKGKLQGTGKWWMEGSFSGIGHDGSDGLVRDYAGYSNYWKRPIFMFTSMNGALYSGKPALEIAAGNGQWKRLVFTTDYPENIPFLVSLKISGGGFEYRKLYVGNKIFGQQGALIELATLKDAPLAGNTIHAVYLDTDGNVNVEMTNGTELGVDVKTTGIGQL